MKVHYMSSDIGTFDQWWEHFQKLAKDKYFPIATQDDYLGMYEEGLTPEDALDEEINNA